MKKNLLKVLSLALVCLLILYFVFTLPLNKNFGKELKTSFRSSGKTIEINENGNWEEFKIVGVNLGSGYPGLYPNELGIKKDVYFNWFKLISDMNVNTIRVYQLQSPEFYSAFLKFNKQSKKKLYLIQGIDFSDSFMYTEKNIFSPDIQNKIYKDTKDLIDAIHGCCLRYDYEKDNLQIYINDVSPYVLGYGLGVEWDELFVEYVCKNNPNKKYFDGDYFKCIKANPFEIFLAQWGEMTLQYEEDRYNEQKLISFCNWTETDPLKNEIKISEIKPQNVNINKLDAMDNIEVFIDTENIIKTSKLKSGTFASYNVYPYYPLFLQYGEYTKYVDETGMHNPYRKYLTELVNHHSCPVVITEYGIPSSRSNTYSDIWRNFSHGGLNEKEQGEIVVKLFDDINKAGCAGSLVFTWQDEWYKRAWNELLISDPNGRAFWSNAQCVEQLFGILSFDPGTGKEKNYPDGDISEWSKKDIVSKSEGLTLSMKSDEKYVYLMAKGIDKRKDKSAINIALDVTPKSGVNKQDNKSFARDVDFIIKIGYDKKGAVYVHDKYDTLVYSMFDKLQPGMNVSIIKKLDETYRSSKVTMYEGSSFNIVTRASGSVTGFMNNLYDLNRVGVLKEGNANPESPNYNSNADFFIKDDIVEIRIPWQILNFYNPSQCKIIDDLEENSYSIKGLKIKNIYADAYYDDDTEVSSFGAYKLKGWRKPHFHERPKQSYYILQKAFGEVN